MRRSPAQALVEAALVLPMLVVVSLGVLQVILYAHARDVLMSAVQEGARLAAEDGRDLAEGGQRAQVLVSAGLGQSVDPVHLLADRNDELVVITADTSLRVLLPLPGVAGLPLHAEARVARERFRPGGGGTR